jgi:hypothetical protein
MSGVPRCQSMLHDIPLSSNDEGAGEPDVLPLAHGELHSEVPGLVNDGDGTASSAVGDPVSRGDASMLIGL